jgi:hypothetical protein
MANPEDLKRLGDGTKEWNRWRKQNRHKMLRPDFRVAGLHDAKLRKANLKFADLSGAFLNGADLRDANLSGAQLQAADLPSANLTRAIIVSADLRNANLEYANLEYANLLGADLSHAKLRGAKLGHAAFGWTILGSVDLSVVQGLETIIHDGPSSVGIDTLYKSKGEIPEVFLRGAGVTEEFITYVRSLVGKRIQFYSCFISHSSADQRFCDRLYADLQARDIRVWYFPEDATWGKPMWGEIDRGIKIYDKLVVVCSRKSLASGPVLREIDRALNREDREHKDVLFPLRIDDHLFKKWEYPRKDDVLQKVVGDFTGWDSNAEKYETSLEKLIMALKSEPQISK